MSSGDAPASGLLCDAFKSLKAKLTGGGLDGQFFLSRVRFDVNPLGKKGNVPLVAKTGYERFVLVGFFTAKLMVDVAAEDIQTNRLPQIAQDVQHCDRIRPAGDSDKDFAARFNRYGSQKILNC
jgi:hypothetical protein